MKWEKNLSKAIKGIPDTVSSNDVIIQALKVLRQRSCYRKGDRLYHIEMIKKKGRDHRVHRPEPMSISTEAPICPDGLLCVGKTSKAFFGYKG